MNFLACCVAVWALIAPFAALAQDQKYLDYLTSEGDQPHLKSRLTLRDEIRGFAGLSGRMWAIETDGRWSLVDLQPAGSGKVKEIPRQSGRLMPNDLVALAKDLSTYDLAGMPARSGENPKVNPQRIVLKFGDKETVLYGIVPRRKNETIRELIVKSAPAPGTPGAAIWSRWEGLANAIESRTASPKP